MIHTYEPVTGFIILQVKHYHYLKFKLNENHQNEKSILFR